MSSKNGEQPAFPCDWKDFQPETGMVVPREQYQGLTKREEFAKAAMTGLLASPVVMGALNDAAAAAHLPPESLLPAVASMSRVMADAMLAELEKKQ